MSNDDVYPITRSWIYLDHEPRRSRGRGASTRKFYRAEVMEAANGRAILIKRFGKSGQFGDIVVQKFTRAKAAHAAMTDIVQDKMKSNYMINASRSRDGGSEFSSDDQLKKSLGITFLAKLDPDDILHLDPDFDTSGMRKREDPRLDEDGRLNQRTIEKERKRREAELRDLRLQQEREEQAQYEQHSDFGVF